MNHKYGNQATNFSSLLEMDSLLATLRHKNIIIHENNIVNFLSEMRKLGLLNGYQFDSNSIYMAIEKYSNKSDLFGSLKARIGLAASLKISSGQIIGVDGGSTTLELASSISNDLEARAISELEIFTNSIPVLTKISSVLAKMEVSDKDTVCRLHVLAGWCRPKSLTISIGEEKINQMISDGILPNRLDVSFVGADGFVDDCGIGMTNKFEIPFKQYLIDRSDKVFILIDSSKFLVKKPTTIGNFLPKMCFITDNQNIYEKRARDIVEKIELSGASLVVIDH